jgi:hypothetical protein
MFEQKVELEKWLAEEEKKLLGREERKEQKQLNREERRFRRVWEQKRSR